MYFKYTLGICFKFVWEFRDGNILIFCTIRNKKEKMYIPPPEKKNFSSSPLSIRWACVIVI